MNRINHSFPLDLLSDGSQATPSDKRSLDSIVKDIENKITSTIKKSLGGVEDIITRVSKYLINVEVIVKNEVRPAMSQLARMFIPEALSLYGYTRAMIIEPYEKRTISVSIRRPDTQTIPLREILESKEFEESEDELPIALGIDSENNTVVADLAKMPHLLISGAMGQGKTVLLHSIILSLLYKLSPADLKLVLIDPMQVEFNQFNIIGEYNQFNIIGQYLLQTSNTSTEVITDIEKVPTILRSIDYEVRHRYDLLRISGCRTICEYNQKLADGKLSKDQHNHLPYIIVVIDEFADLMITQGRDFVTPLVGITQRSQAVGIHLVIATRRPSTDIITGVIKANFPTRIAFKVCSEIDSKTILDTTGAEQLLGMGDMLFNNSGSITRIQGCFVDNEEIESVCDWLAKESPKDTSYVSTNQKNKTPFGFKRLINLLKFGKKKDH